MRTSIRTLLSNTKQDVPMVSSKEAVQRCGSLETLSARYTRIRSTTPELCRHLQTEDFVVQSMSDVSPTKWHLAHVTWFFERFVLLPHAGDYQPLNDQYHYLFNSYYNTAGKMHERPKRGLLTRPTVREILKYREHVDDAVQELLAAKPDDEEIAGLITLGLNHEQQHQELVLTDIKHVFFCNPLKPAINPELSLPPNNEPPPYSFVNGACGIREIGATGPGFSFDNETPLHQTLLHEHQIGTRLITNGEYLEFIRDGGYDNSELWLADGWMTINERDWNRPLYWTEDVSCEFTLGGLREFDLNLPVTHISFYEADAFARWAGARLPTEAEWEVAARDKEPDGNFMESEYWHPAAAGKGDSQFFGDVWEWTSSSYGPYPGFKPLAGTLGEYNGKFMCNQMTVRGGSCTTAEEHIRASYRSFFYPDARWQFLGLRLAKDSIA